MKIFLSTLEELWRRQLPYDALSAVATKEECHFVMMSRCSQAIQKTLCSQNVPNKTAFSPKFFFPKAPQSSAFVGGGGGRVENVHFVGILLAHSCSFCNIFMALELISLHLQFIILKNQTKTKHFFFFKGPRKWVGRECMHYCKMHT